MGKLTAMGVLLGLLMSQALLVCCRNMDHEPKPPSPRDAHSRGGENLDYHSLFGLQPNIDQVIAKARRLLSPEDLKVYSNVMQAGVRTLMDNIGGSSGDDDDQSFSRDLEKEQDSESLAMALKDVASPERMKKFREAYETASRALRETARKLNLSMESTGVFRDMIDPATEARVKGLIKKAAQTFSGSGLGQDSFNPVELVKGYLGNGQDTDLRDLLQPQNLIPMASKIFGQGQDDRDEDEEYQQVEEDDEENADLEDSVPHKRSKSQSVGSLALAATKALFDNSFKKFNKKRNADAIAEGNPEERSLPKQIHASDDTFDRDASDSDNTKDFLGEMQSSIRALVGDNNGNGQSQSLVSSVRELFRQPSGVDEIMDTASRLLQPNNLKTRSDVASSAFRTLNKKLLETVSGGDASLGSSARDLLQSDSFSKLGEVANAAMKTLSNVHPERNDNSAAAAPSSNTRIQQDPLQDMAELTKSFVRGLTDFNKAIGSKNDLTSETRVLHKPNGINEYGNMVNSAVKLAANLNDRFKDQTRTNGVIKPADLKSKEPLDLLRLLDSDTGNSQVLNQLRDLISADSKSANNRIEMPRDQSGLATYEELIQEGYVLCRVRKTVTGSVESFPLKLSGMDKVIMGIQLPIPNPEGFDVLGIMRIMSTAMKGAQDQINVMIKTQGTASTTVKPKRRSLLDELFERQGATPPTPLPANHMLLTVEQALGMTKYPCQLLDLAQSFLLNSTMGQLLDMKDWRLPVSDFTHSLNPMEILYLAPMYRAFNNMIRPMSPTPTTTTTTTTTAKPQPNIMNDIAKIFQG